MSETAAGAATATRARRRARVHVPMGHYDARVTAVRRLTPHMVRVTFGGPGLAGFVDDGPDQRLKLFLPRAGAERTRVPDVPRGADWYPRWRATDPDVRAVMRTYTVRASRPEAAELDIDFVLHGDRGPASAWAGRAEAGDAAVLYGAYAEHDPTPEADWRLIVGDETAVPAIGAILDDLPAGTPARVFAEVADEAECRTLTGAPGVDVTWVPRGGAPAGETSVLLSTLRGADLPDGVPYAWVAGESGAVKEIRRHLVRDRRIPKEAVTFMGYWRRGGPIEES